MNFNGYLLRTQFYVGNTNLFYTFKNIHVQNAQRCKLIIFKIIKDSIKKIKTSEIKILFIYMITRTKYTQFIGQIY